MLKKLAHALNPITGSTLGGLAIVFAVKRGHYLAATIFTALEIFMLVLLFSMFKEQGENGKCEEE